METEQKTTARDKKHLRYYDRHKDEILAKRKEVYQANKDAMKQKVLERYYKKKSEKEENEKKTPASISE
jgi:hypothetical protein